MRPPATVLADFMVLQGDSMSISKCSVGVGKLDQVLMLSIEESTEFESSPVKKLQL